MVRKTDTSFYQCFQLRTLLFSLKGCGTKFHKVCWKQKKPVLARIFNLHWDELNKGCGY